MELFDWEKYLNENGGSESPAPLPSAPSEMAPDSMPAGTYIQHEAPSVPQDGEGPRNLQEYHQHVSYAHGEICPGGLEDLDFPPGLNSLEGELLYFMTAHDRLTAYQRGFKTAIDVYTERRKWANIETTDINLAWFPSLQHWVKAVPGQPVCGTAAYIAAVRGDLDCKFAPGEKVYIDGTEINPDTLIDIPMLHYSRQVLEHRRDYCKPTYTYPRTKTYDAEDQTSFMASQAEWSPNNLPPSAAILEPYKFSKTKAPTLVNSNGEAILDARGQARSAFDHVLPARISHAVDGWVIAAWLSEDPRMQYKDIEAHMAPGKTLGQLPDKYHKYRDRIPAMTRGAGKKDVPTNNERATVQKYDNDQLAGNSWWHVDLNTNSMCQTMDPRIGVFISVPVYSLPMRHKQNGEFSDRVRKAKEWLEKNEHAQQDTEPLSAVAAHDHPAA